MSIGSLKQVATAFRCDPHKFKYLRESTSGGILGLCTQCKCRFTAWPGTIYYEEILAAKGREE